MEFCFLRGRIRINYFYLVRILFSWRLDSDQDFLNVRIRIGLSSRLVQEPDPLFYQGQDSVFKSKIRIRLFLRLDLYFMSKK